MKFKKLLLVSALSAGLAFGIAACSETNSNKSFSEAQLLELAQTNRLSKERLQEWVDGLQVAFPLYAISLKSYEDQGNDVSLATLVVAIGKPSTQAEESDLYMKAMFNLKIEHGVKVENGMPSIARITSESYEFDAEGLSEDELAEANTAIMAFMNKIQSTSESLAIIEPDGEFFAQTKGSQLEILDEGNVIKIPSYNSKTQTYDGRKLLRSDIEIPSILILGEDGEFESEVHNIQVSMKDRPIRDAVYGLNGSTEINIAKIVGFEGTGNSKMQFVLLEGIKYTEHAKVNDKGLLSADFAAQFTGKMDVPAHMDMDMPESARNVSLAYHMTGKLQNLDAKSYMAISQMMMDNPNGWMEDENGERVAVEMISHGFSMSVDKLNIALNGHTAEAQFKISMPVLEEADKKMPLTLLVMSKAEAEGSARVPLKWFELFEPDAAKREQAIEGITMMFGEYIERQGDYFVSNFSYKQGQMKVNGRPLNMMNMM